MTDYLATSIILLLSNLKKLRCEKRERVRLSKNIKEFGKDIFSLSSLKSKVHVYKQFNICNILMETIFIPKVFFVRLSQRI